MFKVRLLRKGNKDPERFHGGRVSRPIWLFLHDHHIMLFFSFIIILFMFYVYFMILLCTVYSAVYGEYLLDMVTKPVSHKPFSLTVRSSLLFMLQTYLKIFSICLDCSEY